MCVFTFTKHQRVPCNAGMMGFRSIDGGHKLFVFMFKYKIHFMNNCPAFVSVGSVLLEGSAG